MSTTKSDFNDTQAQIVQAIHGADGPVVSKHIKDAIDSVGRSAVEKQLLALRDRGILEVVGSEQVHGGDPANVFALTDAGTRAARRHEFETETEIALGTRVEVADGEAADQVADLLDQVRALREKVMELDMVRDKQAERIDDLETTLDDHEDRMDTLRKQNEWLRDQLDGE